MWAHPAALTHAVTAPTVAAVVAAHNEETTIARTVKELLALGPVGEVIVAADGSTDRTAAEAAGAGARVLVSATRRGKGRAVEAALGRVPGFNLYLLIDGDVGETASEAGRLLEPVLAGEAAMAIGVLPPLPGGGFGMVKGLARMLIRRLTRFDPMAPLSGQRAMTAEVVRACRPLAAGFGLETALTIDAARLGFSIRELDVDMVHRPSGRGISGFLHRGAQGVDILRAVLPRALRLR